MQLLFTSSHRKRLLIVVIAFFTLLTIITVKLVSIMTMQADDYGYRARAVQERERSIKAKRGSIYDRNGVVLAGNQAVCSISVIYNQIEDPETVIRVLSEKLELPEEDVRRRVEKRSVREKIKSNVDKELADEIRAMNLAGVMIDEDYKRYYPYSTLASHVLGFTGSDNQGIVGLEVYYDDLLMGENGSINTVTNARGIEVENMAERRVEGTAGQNLVTSIDINIQQYITQKALEVLEKKQAKRVCIIVMNPQNGEIYALADVPEYNLNEPFTLNYETDETVTQDMWNQMWRNYCISDTYEPGSTFKIVTATTAFEQGVLRVEDQFYCPGYHIVEDRRIRCHKVAGHGAETFREGIMNSCNPVFMQVGERIGVDGFYDGLRKLGLFEQTGVDLPGEANSIFHKQEKVGPVELATMSFGQSFQITPLQLMRAAAAVVNGGNLVTPHFGVYTTDEKLFEEIVENSDVMSTAGGIASISQIAGTACMSKCYYWVDAFLEHLKKNRDYAVDRLNQMPMIKAYRPHATYLLYVDIRAFGMKSEEFTDYMKEKVKLAVVSGGEKFFGSGSEGYIRICFATSHEILEEGLNRLEKGIDMLIREKNLEK